VVVSSFSVLAALVHASYDIADDDGLFATWVVRSSTVSLDNDERVTMSCATGRTIGRSRSGCCEWICTPDVIQPRSVFDGPGALHQTAIVPPTIEIRHDALTPVLAGRSSVVPGGRCSNDESL